VVQPLTERQQEYFDFIRNYIQENECAPRLDEIATHFGVSSPTAHKALRTLREKGYLYFGRDSHAGFFIRLFEFEDTVSGVSEIPFLGDVDSFGIVRNFPQKTVHSATPTLRSNPEDLFGLHVAGNLPAFKMLPHDVLIMDQGKVPQVGDICLTLINEYRVLIQITDEDEQTGRLSWITLDEDNYKNPVIADIQGSQDSYQQSLPRDFILATALRLTRYLAH
jgi:SOS-response transcriptional repressor LexA